MILKQLVLHNFCLYRGEQTFDLTPARRRGRIAPIILFGGINGGGKTTLLDAVQLVLYGNRARCSKRFDKPYDIFLRESIHHGVDPGEGAAIRLSFRYAAQGQDNLYEVSRSWSANGRGRVRERVQVCKNGEIDDWLSENWSQQVEELIPFGIAQLCFFDAEKIRFLAEDETSTQALGGAIKSLLGLDLAERLVTDAAVLEGRIAKRARESPDLRQVERLEGELDTKQAAIDRLVQELGALENLREVARNRLTHAEEQFAEVGGQHWEQREMRQRQLGELEHTLRETGNRLVALAATELPLALVPDLLRDVKVQANRERRAAENRIVARLLSERDEQLSAVLKRNRASREFIEVVQQFLSIDRETRVTQTDIVERLGLSDAGWRLLEHLLERGLAKRAEDASQLLKQLHSGRRSLETVQRTLAATPEEDAVREVAVELKTASAELASLDQRANRFEKQLAAVRSEREEIQKQLRKLRRKIVDEGIHSEEDARLGALLVRTQEAMQEFLRRATDRKIDKLSELISESFRYLLRKKTLVQRVCVDPRTFAINLYDDTGRRISKRRLSEGEKQIFAISVLWGLSRASARPLPAIIDTPMARLDAKHRDQLVERYFPYASHQVIVLSTDTEVERRYFHNLQPHIARAYHLNYDEQRKATVAEEGYFWGTESAAETKELTV